MNIRAYFNKNGVIYGVSSIRQGKQWKNNRILVFTDLDKAIKWLFDETSCFEYRTLTSRTNAKKLTGAQLNEEDGQK